MAFNFVLPDLGEGIAEGEIRKWLVKEGSTIEEHQAVLRSRRTRPSWRYVTQRGDGPSDHQAEGDTVKVGEVLIVIGETGEKSGNSFAAKERPNPRNGRNPCPSWANYQKKKRK